MPPKRAKATRASPPSNEPTPHFPPPSTNIPIQADDEQRTPERSPAKRAAGGISQAQKQALIDNLQLEITERARKLRAQYALQAQGLRTRLEMRVNRIPQALRQRNMQELMEEHAEKATPTEAPPVPAKNVIVRPALAAVAKEPERKSLKRQSDHISTVHVDSNDNDKENSVPTVLAIHQEDLSNPKKRAKTTTTTTTTTTANTKATRTASRKVQLQPPSNVLSPRSHNSRTLPRSPFKHAPSSSSTHLARPISPVKPSIQHHLAPPSKPSSRAPSRQAKRGTPAPAAETETDAEGRSSEASITSAGTTIVTKPAAAAGKRGGPAAAKKPAAAAGGRKPVATTAAAAGRKKENMVPAPVPAVGGGRTLRKRG